MRRTLPQLAGVATGFGLMVTLIAPGLGLPLMHSQLLQQVVQVIGALWMARLAWKLATAPLAGDLRAAAPFSFPRACVLQWVIPKGWLMALAATATFRPPGANALVFGPLIGLVFTLVNVPCVDGFGLIGANGKGLLNHPARLRVFNLTMAVFLIGTVIVMLFE